VLVEHLALRLHTLPNRYRFNFDGTAPEFNSEGIDYSISYLRKENESELFTRGSSLIITGGSNFSVPPRE
jgi:hypothetical protein